MSSRVSAVILATLFGAAPLALRAQVIRGTVTDDLTKRPVAAALMTLLDSTGAEVAGISARTDSSGTFAIFARGLGTYQVRATRVGYRPATSPLLTLGLTDVTRLRMSLTVVAQRVTPVTIVERRQLSVTELDGRTGFDYRRAKFEKTFEGHFMTDSDLVGMTSISDIKTSGKVGAGNFGILIFDGHVMKNWAELDGHVFMPDVAAIEVWSPGSLPPGAIGHSADAVSGHFLTAPVTLVWTKGYMEWMDSVAAHEAAHLAPPQRPPTR